MEKKLVTLMKNIFYTFCMTTSMLWLLALPALAVQAYQPETTDPISESWRWHSIEELNGKGYRCMTEAVDKSVWFGVDEGAMRYDGVTWTLFTPEDGLAGAPVTALCGAKDGSIYVGSNQGVSRFENGEWHRIFPLQNDFNGSITHIYQTSDGSIWAAIDDGALRIKNDQYTLYTVESVTDPLKFQAPNLKWVIVPHQSKLDGSFAVHTFFQDQQGALWFGLRSGIIVRHELKPAKPDDPSAWQIFTQQEGLDIGRHPTILQLSDGSIWCLSNMSTTRINIYKNNHWSHLSLDDYGGTNIHTSIIETPDGAIWIGGFRMLHVFKNGKWSIYNRPAAPIPAARMDLLYSSDGSVWIAGWMSDVVKLDYLTHRWTTYQDLNYECDTPDKTQWFIAWDNGVVSYNTSTYEWKKYTVIDGLMDAPIRLIVTRDGELIAAGSQRHFASVAHFNGQSWIRHDLEEMGWGITDRAVFESSDGSIWFGADSPPILTVPRGVKRYYPSKGPIDDEDAWTFYRHPQLNESIICFGETSDGRIWNYESKGLSTFDGVTNTLVTDPEALVGVTIECMFTTSDLHLWMGTRGKGIFYFNDEFWQQYTVEDGLVSNNIAWILIDSQNSVWAGTMNGVSRFDGNTWITRALPDAMYIEPQNGSIRQSLDGAIWINNRYREWGRRAYSSEPLPKRDLKSKFQATRYQPDTEPPNTVITMYEEKVSQPGNAILSWKGADPWNITAQEDILYSYRMDDGEWSPYTAETQHIFLSVKSGRHRFEVRSRDNDLNVDPEPAIVEFKVIAPLYKQAWFIAMIVLFLGTIGYFQYRIFQREKHLRESNEALKEKTDEVAQKSDEIEASYKRLFETGNILASNSEIVNQATAHINKAMNEVKEGAISQDESVRQTHNMVDTLLSTIHEVSYETKTSAKAAQITVSAVESGTQALQDTLDSVKIIEQNVNETWNTMKTLMEHSDRIGQIVQFVNDVASRVNVLALNALIEAVKADKYGKGFMVVAKEVRELAKRTSESIFEISDFIEKMQSDVSRIEKTAQKGIESVRLTADLTDQGQATLNIICQSVEDEKERLTSIAGRIASMQELSTDVQQAIESVASVSQRNRESVEQVNVSTNEVGDRVRDLRDLAQSLMIQMNKNA